MKTILIGTSKFGSPVSDYYKELGTVFVESNYRVIYIFDGQVKQFPKTNHNQLYFSWPNRRPTKLKDFIFLFKMIKKYKPMVCISNFGSTNVISIVSYLLKVKYRINYIHTTTKAVDNDSLNAYKTRILRLRKKFVLKLNTHYLTNSLGNKEDTIAAFKINKKSILVLPLLLNRSTTPYTSKVNRDLSLVIVGGLTYTKGHEQLIYQFSNCLKKYPDLKLKIIGGGYFRK